MGKTVCKDCGGPRGHNNPLISRCKMCTYKRSEANPKQTRIKTYKPINKVSSKRKERLSKYSEKDMFREILIERQNEGMLRCEVCDKEFSIENAGPVCFAHILAKGLYPALRLLKNNIAIVCNDINTNSCHNKMDQILSGNKKELEAKILNLERINLNDYKKQK